MHLKCEIKYNASLPAMLNLLHISMDHELLKSTFVPAMKIKIIFGFKESHCVLPPNQHVLPSAKMNGTQRRTLVSP